MPPVGDLLSFDHVQMYVQSLRPIEEYRQMEARQGELAHALGEEISIEKGRELWNKICHGHAKNPAEYSAAGQDPVEQLIMGMGWRIIGHHETSASRSYVLSSSDSHGAVFVATTALSGDHAQDHAHKAGKHEGPYLDGARVKQFIDSRNGRYGFSVLAFQVQSGHIETVLEQYKKTYPQLLLTPDVTVHNVPGGSVKILEAYMYQLPDLSGPDKGTLLRYIERAGDVEAPALPGVQRLHPTFDKLSSNFYSDHWVSNVSDRKDFLTIMERVLGFNAKVDFNAGVVGAGEAVIESTVTGNSAASSGLTPDNHLGNQSQIYLPTNNALSEHGHVSLFLKEIGQGIQHIACRCADLVRLVSRTNSFREITGQGFSFLRIPRSYYGRLSVQSLVQDGIPEAVAAPLIHSLEAAKLLTLAGVVSITITDADVQALIKALPADAQALINDDLAQTIVHVVKRGRYNNLYKLLRDHLSEATYLKIVANQVLVDIQGQDILYQIFTSNVMQQRETDEAPFFEFIQRVCSEALDASGNPKPIRPGCGGFGIRNFLTLFLSIEVSKAMQMLDAAKSKGDAAEAAFAQKVIDIFTSQLESSNPILTAISDAMTAEADARDLADKAKTDEERAAHLAEVERQAKIKLSNQDELMHCGEKHKAMMAQLRASRA